MGWKSADRAGDPAFTAMPAGEGPRIESDELDLTDQGNGGIRAVAILAGRVRFASNFDG